MLNILVIEDDSVKYGKVHTALMSVSNEQFDIVQAPTVAQGIALLESRRFDLLLLDINVPRRLGEGVRRGGGVEILKELTRTSTLNRPQHIVGLTAYDDLIEEFEQDFEKELWSLIKYSENSDEWISQIKGKVQYLSKHKRSAGFSDGKTFGVDLAIVCALESVELAAIKNLPISWQPLRFHHDETRYISGSIMHEGRTFSVVAASATRMGMPAAAVLTSKIISQFRPRFLAMAGICAGRKAKVNLGDIVVADPSWDWGSGKIISKRNTPHFQPSPHDIELDVDLRSKLEEISLDVALLAEIKAKSRGNKPSSELNLKIGPLASGAAVVADKKTFERLLDRNRDVLGLEMEAYGVSAACRGSGRPRPTSVVMKSVCDYADEDKSDDFQEYAAHTSAWALYHAALRFL